MYVWFVTKEWSNLFSLKFCKPFFLQLSFLERERKKERVLSREGQKDRVEKERTKREIKREIK